MFENYIKRVSIVREICENKLSVNMFALFCRKTARPLADVDGHLDLDSCSQLSQQRV